MLTQIKQLALSIKALKENDPLISPLPQTNNLQYNIKLDDPVFYKGLILLDLSKITVFVV